MGGMKGKERTRSSWAEIVIAVFSVLSAAILAFAAYEAYRAANIYEEQTRFQVRDGLIKFDRDILSGARAVAWRESFYVELPDGGNSRERAEIRLRLMLKDVQQMPSWEDIPSLSRWLWEPQDFYAEVKVRTREAYAQAEDLLYLLNNVYDAYATGFIAPGEYRTWMSYLYENGQHPLFLVALHFWHQAGFLTEEFAAELRLHFLKSLSNRETAQAIFPTLLKDDWPKKVGEKYFGPKKAAQTTE